MLFSSCKEMLLIRYFSVSYQRSICSFVFFLIKFLVPFFFNYNCTQLKWEKLQSFPKIQCGPSSLKPSIVCNKTGSLPFMKVINRRLPPYSVSIKPTDSLTRRSTDGHDLLKNISITNFFISFSVHFTIKRI